MAVDALNPIALKQLQSKDQGELLDAIDRLRSLGVSNYINLPQLIVCGDQSSGKSSVLEAISLVQFPTKDHLCTRFATELVLRRTHDTHTAVTIRPGPSRSAEDRERLLQFNEPFPSAEDFPNLIESAKKCMGVSSEGFSEDVLCVESSGPDRPHLTIVDLPGLIHTPTRGQSEAEVKSVTKMVGKYMSNPRSIILAVVTAKTDFANQIVMTYARSVDPEGRRTLGIITKPDTLNVGSDSEKEWIKIAKNENIHLRLGWHVLKNRDFNTQHFTMEERDQAEDEFFSKRAWSGLPEEFLGISSLRVRLQKLFNQHICNDLPTIIQEIKNGLETCKQKLSKLGDPRPTAREQRAYLTHISQEFHSLAKAAVDGVYNDGFFREIDMTGVEKKKLRSVIRSLNDEFADNMQERGHYQQIVSNTGSPNSFIVGPGAAGSISREDFLLEVEKIDRANKGCELPGTLSPFVPVELFHRQSRPWEEIATQHLDKVWAAAKAFLDLALEHIIGPQAASILLTEYIDPLMETKLKELQGKLAEILRPYQFGHLLTCNRSFKRYVEAQRLARRRSGMLQDMSKTFGKEASQDLASYAESINHLGPSQNESKSAFSEAVDQMEAYYETAFNVFVDNVAALVIENCLIADVPNLFSPDVVVHMNDDQLDALAAESKDVQYERAQQRDKISTLETGLRTCHRFVGKGGSLLRKQAPVPAPVSAPVQIDSVASPSITRTPATPDGSDLSRAPLFEPLPPLETPSRPPSSSRRSRKMPITFEHSSSRQSTPSPARKDSLFDVASSPGSNVTVPSSASSSAGGSVQSGNGAAAEQEIKYTYGKPSITKEKKSVFGVAGW